MLWWYAVAAILAIGGVISLLRAISLPSLSKNLNISFGLILPIFSSEKTGFSANECAFIGDSLKKDVEGSTKCGLRGIWYTQGKEPEMEAKFPVIKSFENVNIDELLK